MTSSTPPVFDIPRYAGTNVLGGAMAAALTASRHVPALDLRDLPRPPDHLQSAAPTPA